MIRVLAAKELRGFFTSPFAWGVIAVLQIALAYLFLLQIDFFNAIQPQLAAMEHPPGFSELIVSPLFSTLALILLAAIPLLAMRQISEERRAQTLVLLLSSPISLGQIVLGKFFGLMGFCLFIIALASAMALSLGLGGALDWRLLLANILGVTLLSSALGALGLWISSFTTQPTFAALGAVTASVLLWLLGAGKGDNANALQYVSPLTHYERLNRGVLDTADVAYFLIFTLLFLWLTWRRVAALRRV